MRTGPPRDTFRGGNLCGARRGAFWKRPGGSGRCAALAAPSIGAAPGGGWGLRLGAIRAPGGPQRGDGKRIRKDSPAAEGCRADLLFSVCGKVLALLPYPPRRRGVVGSSSINTAAGGGSPSLWGVGSVRGGKMSFPLFLNEQ